MLHQHPFASQQRISLYFDLFPDTLPEGTEAFQITLSSVASRSFIDERARERVEILPTPEILIRKVAVVIEDDDCEFQTHAPYIVNCIAYFLYKFISIVLIIGFANTSYTVSETVGILQVDVQVFNLPDDQRLPATVNLVIQSVSGSASINAHYYVPVIYLTIL